MIESPVTRRFFRLPFLYLCVTVGLLAQASCSVLDDGDPLSASEASDNLSGPCGSEGQTKTCHLTSAISSDALSCASGSQSCENGQWSNCSITRQYKLSLSGNDPGSSSRLLALSSPGPCENNPCNPYCSQFVESPDGGLVPIFQDAAPDVVVPVFDAGPDVVGPTVEFDWASGTFNNFPTNSLFDLFNEPCVMAEDCQQNSYCNSPTFQSCEHSLCETGIALTDDCNSCVTEICNLDASCCDTASTACTHDACVTGAALNEDCNGCVFAICDTMPSCCDTTWDQACIDAIATECQPPNTTPASCDVCGENQIESNDGTSCFAITSTSDDWVDSRGDCATLYGAGWDLAKIDNSTDNNAILAVLDNDDYWIGANDRSSEGNWVWASDSSSVGYDDWRSGQPNNYNGQDCGEYWDGADWNDEGCEASNQSSCQGPGSPTLSGGVGPTNTGWTQSCVDMVESVCGAYCEDGSPTPASGACVMWFAGDQNSCDDYDLSLGMACDDGTNEFVTVCNHGNAWAPPGVKVAYFPEDSGEFRSNPPDMGLSLGSCTTSEAGPPGWCINSPCAGIPDGAEMIVNPLDGTELPDECETGDNWGLYFSNSCGTPICSGTSDRATIKSVNIMFVIARSGSMDDDTPTRWASTMGAMKSFVSDPASAGLAVGLRFFPDDNVATQCNGSTCSVATCSIPQVDVRQLKPQTGAIDVQETAMMAALSAESPGGYTPMRVALEGALVWGANRQTIFTDDIHAVVLVTDGEPNDCGNATDVANVAGAAYTATGVPTYVIGIEGVSKTTIENIATAGGGSAFFISSSNGNVTDQIIDSLKTIAEDVIDCNFTLRNPQNLDDELAVVNYIPRPASTEPDYCLNDQTESDGHCYYIDPVSVSQNKAKANCRVLGPGWELASITDSVENDFLTTLNVSSYNSDAFIGLKDNSSWAWTNGEAFAFENWGASEPSGSGDCAELEPSGDWNDYSCSNRRDYICEGPEYGSLTCRTGEFEAPDGNCYAVLPSDTYANARAACQAYGAGWDAAIVTSAAENSQIDEFITESTWLGGDDIASEGTWDWHDGTNFGIPGTGSGCAIGSEFGTNCYYYNSSTNNWSDAQNACQSLGASWDLTSVLSAEEHTFVVSFTSSEIWLGGNDRAVEGQWRWPDGTLFWSGTGSGSPQPDAGTYTNWYGGSEPNDSDNSDCMRTYSSSERWSDRYCSLDRRSVCKGDMDTVALTVPVGFNAWAGGEPNGASSDCMVITTSGTWTDTACAFTYPIVCEGPKIAVPPVVPAGGILNQVTDVSGCNVANDDEWYYDDNSNPAQIRMCPTACTRVQRDVTARLSIEVGCLPTAPPPPNPYVDPGDPPPVATSYTESYQSDCSTIPNASNPEWSWLTYESSTPGASSVNFSARTAESEAGLAAEPWIVLATASTANGNSSCGQAGPGPLCPVNLLTALGSGVNTRKDFFEIKIDLVPVGDDGPTVSGWDITFQCAPQQ